MEKLPESDDLRLFIDIADTLEKKAISLNDVARALQCSPSAISVCIDRLESLTRKRLIVRTKEGSALSRFGKDLLEDCQDVVGRLRKLGSKRRKTQQINVASTANIKSNIIVGAVAAHMLLHSNPDEVDLRVRVDTMDYPEIIRALRVDDHYAFGCGWDLDVTLYPDIYFRPLLNNVGFVALIPDREVLKHTNQVDLLELVDSAGTGVVSLDQLKKSLAEKRLVAVRTEYSSVRDEILPVADASKVVWVDNSEDALICIRMGLADVGWGPEPYRKRQWIKCLLIVDDNRVKIGKSVMAYLRREKPTPQKASTDLSQGTGTKMWQSLPEDGEALLKTIHDFLDRYGPKVVSGDLSSKEVLEWVEARKGG